MIWRSNWNRWNRETNNRSIAYWIMVITTKWRNFHSYANNNSKVLFIHLSVMNTQTISMSTTFISVHNHIDPQFYLQWNIFKASMILELVRTCSQQNPFICGSLSRSDFDLFSAIAIFAYAYNLWKRHINEQAGFKRNTLRKKWKTYNLHKTMNCTLEFFSRLSLPLFIWNVFKVFHSVHSTLWIFVFVSVFFI